MTDVGVKVSEGDFWNMTDWRLEKDINLKLHEYDPVSKPKHYGTGDIECITYIQDFLTEEEYIGYLRGNIAKYLHRWRYKNGIEDLKKSEWYGARLIKLMEEIG